MKTLVQCFILVVCAICASTSMHHRCKCIRTAKRVNTTLISSVNIINPSPYCNKKQVIVTFKNNSQTCLDPSTKFLQDFLKALQLKLAGTDDKSESSQTKAASRSSTTNSKTLPTRGRPATSVADVKEFTLC